MYSHFNHTALVLPAVCNNLAADLAVTVFVAAATAAVAAFSLLQLQPSC
jgi:hypothetical protein